MENDSPPETEAGRKRRQPSAGDEASRWLLPIGAVARLAAYAGLFFALWHFRPGDISHLPFAAASIPAFAKAMVWMAAGFLLTEQLIKPSRDEAVRRGWGVLGLLMIGVLAIAAIFWTGATH